LGKVKKHVVLHILMFPPDQVSTAYLYGDIVQAFLKANFRVSVFTTTPHYNFKEKFKSNSGFSFFWKKSNYFGAEVHHFPHTHSKRFFMRGINILCFHLAFVFKVLFLRNVDVFITPSPPITAGLLSGLMGRLKGAKSIYNVQEIYPDVLINHLEIKNSFLITVLKKVEKLTYALNDKVVAIDELFANKIKDRLPQHKLTVIPNFVDTELYSPFIGEIRKEYNFEGKFLVGYVGNLGQVQDWNCVLEAAELLSSYHDIHFLFVGGGSEFSFLQNKTNHLDNISVLPYQRRENIPELNQRIDLHFISMASSSDYDGLPSKVFGILSSGKTILAATASDSPLANFLNKSENSRLVKRGDAKAFADAILSYWKLPSSQEEKDRARQFIIKNYSKNTICDKYISLVNSIL